MQPGHDNGGVLIVGGHAIYQQGRWYGGSPGADRYYEGHVLDALRIARSAGYAAVCFSGGRTRDRTPGWPTEVTNSEADGMIDFARDVGMIGCPPPFVIAESLARDYFENIFFSILGFHRHRGQWPSRVGMVGWKYKAVTLYIIAAGLRLGDGCFTFYGSGDPHLSGTMETAAAASARYDSALIRVVDGNAEIVDPLLRDQQQFRSKRLQRMPMTCESNADYLALVKAAYDEDFDESTGRQGDVSNLIDEVEGLAPGPAWRRVEWPWNLR